MSESFEEIDVTSFKTNDSSTGSKLFKKKEADENSQHLKHSKLFDDDE